MRLSLAFLVLIGLSSARAVAIAALDDRSHPHWFCGVPGESCGLKERETQGHSGWCGVPGESCNGRRWPAPHPEPGGRHGFCGIPGESCGFKIRTPEPISEKRGAEPEPEPMAQGKRGYCGIPGGDCGLKHRPGPEPLSEEKRWNHGFCGVPGQSCGLLKRATEVIRDAFAQHWAQPFSKKSGVSVLCDAPGHSCDIARRAVGDISDLAERTYEELHARYAAPIPQGGVGFCGVPGESCGANRQRQSQISYGAQKSDADAAIAAAHALREANPSFLIAECAKEGNECDVLVKARDAFLELKREVDDLKRNDLAFKLHYCLANGCEREVHEYLERALADDSISKQVERSCFSDDGPCLFAQRSLDALERSLDSAIAEAFG